MKNVFMEHTVKRRSSCGRGVLKLKSWNPLPRPGQDNNKQQQRSTGHVAVQSNARGTPFCNGNTERSSKKTENHPSFGVLKGSANRSEAIGINLCLYDRLISCSRHRLLYASLLMIEKICHIIIQ